ncbi:MAG: hypothetical protein ACE15C_17315 [Phycisphaerae bacterium]
MLRMCGVAVLAAVMGGCGGEYIFTVPEQVAPAGGEATIVARLQRREFAWYKPAAGDVAIQFRLEPSPLRAAYTDRQGYAAAGVPAPAAPGLYHVSVALQDKNGREASTFAPLYVLDARQPVVVVDLESLVLPYSTFEWRWPPEKTPPLTGGGASDARAAMEKLARGGLNIIYMTRRPPQDGPTIHAELTAGGFPDGPVLQWQREDWRIVGEGIQTRIVMQSRLVSQLPYLRKQFPLLVAGIGSSDMAIEAFTYAGLKCVIVGNTAATASYATRRTSWADLAAKGL